MRSLCSHVHILATVFSNMQLEFFFHVSKCLAYNCQARFTKIAEIIFYKLESKIREVCAAANDEPRMGEGMLYMYVMMMSSVQPFSALGDPMNKGSPLMSTLHQLSQFLQSVSCFLHILCLPLLRLPPTFPSIISFSIPFLLITCPK